MAIVDVTSPSTKAANVSHATYMTNPLRVKGGKVLIVVTDTGAPTAPPPYFLTADIGGDPVEDVPFDGGKAPEFDLGRAAMMTINVKLQAAAVGQGKVGLICTRSSE